MLTRQTAVARRLFLAVRTEAYRYRDIYRQTDIGTRHTDTNIKKGKGSPYSITERRVPELIPVLGSQPAGDVSRR